MSRNLRPLIADLASTTKGVCIIDVGAIVDEHKTKARTPERLYKRFLSDAVGVVQGYARRTGFPRESGGKRIGDLHRSLGDWCNLVGRGGHCVVIQGVETWATQFGEMHVPAEWVEGLKEYRLRVYSNFHEFSKYHTVIPTLRYETAGELSSFSPTTTAVDLCSRDHGVLITRTSTAFSVFANQCPHVGLSLGDGTEPFSAENDSIICTAHMAEFDPATGGYLRGPCPMEGLRKVPHKVIDGEVQIPTPTVMHYLQHLCPIDINAL